MVVQRRLRRPFAVLAALALILTALGPAAAQDEAVPELGSSTTVERGDWNSYIVVMKAAPLVVTEGRDLATNQARNRGQQLKESHNHALQNAGIDASKKTTDYVNALNGFSALITYEEALRVAADKTVAFVIPDELMQLHTDSSPTFIGLDGNGGAWNSGVTGQGVVVGIIDTGIWPQHPSFADNGMPAPPVTIADLPAQTNPPRPPLRGCDFGNTAHNPNDAPFTCNNKLIGARQVMPTYRALIGATPDEFNSARDDNGHGTHTASTAAGNAGVQAQIFGRNVGDGTISGIAPDAHVVAYKGLGNQGGFGSDLALAIDVAVADGVDVINYSIGGSAAAVTADEIAFLFAADAGVHVATSAGNSGPGAATIRNPAKAPWLTTVGANTQTRFLAGTIQLGSGATFEGASVTLGTGGSFPLVDAATAAPGANGDLCISAATGTSKLDPAVVTGKIVLCRRGSNARVDKSLAVLNAGGVGMILYENDNVGNLFTDNHHVPTVHVDNAPGLLIKAYIAAGGATAEIRNTGALSTWPSAPSMTSFSSRGPNVFADVLKPDITAPGMQILAGNSPFPDPGNVTGQLFQAIAGTSMSSPHVAGLFALLDQAHPDWSAAAARSALMTTANPTVRDNDRVSQATPFGMGAGHVNPGRVDRRGSSFAPGLVYDAGLFDYFGFLCDAQPSVFTNPEATCAILAGAGVPTDASDLNYPSISVAELAGSQTVTRTVTSVAEENAPRTYTVSFDAPDGYAVTVSPSTFTLRRGESATYEVTIVNQSVPVGEWRFGELTWSSQTGGGNTSYNVRSPIAVRAAALDAPESVSGEGETGTASFDVRFGYTGEYDATAHGLVPATVTVDNVPQDPDQIFSRTDGFSDAHTFNLNGVEVFRVALPPESVTVEGVDLDVYVFNPSGQLAGSSGAPDTDEEVTINRPANGTWTVYIHGWQTVGPSADYTMWSWVVSATPGGNLVIDTEPADAVIATTGTVDLSWSGATDGQWHLGAVRHNGPGGAHLGRTLVEVDNR